MNRYALVAIYENIELTNSIGWLCVYYLWCNVTQLSTARYNCWVTCTIELQGGVAKQLS